MSGKNRGFVDSKRIRAPLARQRATSNVRERERARERESERERGVRVTTCLCIVSLLACASFAESSSPENIEPMHEYRLWQLGSLVGAQRQYLYFCTSSQVN